MKTTKMAFFQITINCRITENTKKMISDLIKYDPDRFCDVSNIVRIAIFQLYRKEKPQGKIKQDSVIE